MKTFEAVTPRPGVIFTLGVYTTLYLLLSGLVVFLLVRQIRALHAGAHQ